MKLACLIAITLLACAPLPAPIVLDPHATPMLRVLGTDLHDGDACRVDVATKREFVHLGDVVAHDSIVVEMPFVNQDVTIWVCGVPSHLKIDGPFTWTLIPHPKKPAERPRAS